MSIDEWWNRCAQSFFKNNNDRIPYFDTYSPPEEDSLFLAYSPPEEDSIFVIRFFRVSFSIKLAAVQASGGARMRLDYT
jgi:hypothetical protein